MKDFVIYEHEGRLHLSIGDGYSHSPTSVLAFLRERASIEVLAKKSWLLTDDYQSEFRFKNHDFVLCTPGDSIDIFPIKDAPAPIAAELYRMVSEYRRVSVLAWLRTWVHLLFRPFNYQP